MSFNDLVIEMLNVYKPKPNYPGIDRAAKGPAMKCEVCGKEIGTRGIRVTNCAGGQNAFCSECYARSSDSFLDGAAMNPKGVIASSESADFSAIKDVVNTGECNCGKDGHKLDWINCPVHGKMIRAIDYEHEFTHTREYLHQQTGELIGVDVSLIRGRILYMHVDNLPKELMRDDLPIRLPIIREKLTTCSEGDEDRWLYIFRFRKDQAAVEACR